MKIEIYYESDVHLTEITQPTKIKDLINNISEYLKLKNEKLLLLNYKREILEETYLISPEKEKKSQKFFLLNKSKLEKENDRKEDKKEDKKEEPIEKLISKVTNAKTLLEKKKPEIRTNRLDFMEEIHGGNLGRLLSMLQSLEERNLMNVQMFNTGNNNGNIEPNETHVNTLKEMGFPEDRVRAALIRTRNNINRATDILIEEMDQL